MNSPIKESDPPSPSLSSISSSMSFEGFSCGVLRSNQSSTEKTYAGATTSAGKSPEPIISRESVEEISLKLTPLIKNSTLKKSSVEALTDMKTNFLANVGSEVGETQLQTLKKLSSSPGEGNGTCHLLNSGAERFPEWKKIKYLGITLHHKLK